MSPLRRLAIAACSFALLSEGSLQNFSDSRAAEPAVAEAPANATLPEHLQTLQRHLGGSVVDQFETLRPDQVGAPAWWRQFRGSLDAANSQSQATSGDFGAPAWGAKWSGTLGTTAVVPAAAAEPAAPAPAVSRAITALREVAARLDVGANRLERLEIYQHADALRAQAHALRMEARRMAGTGGLTPNTFPVPALTPTPTTRIPQLMPAPNSSGVTTGTWHLQWDGPTGQGAQQANPGPEPAVAPVWSEDVDSADPAAPPAGTTLTPQPAN